ncbi:MAG: phenylalanine--tRNA ligase subunit alpha [Aquificaceae bacterium]|nr:MAG: phenylalanine--tRNA ligase subunit alpha [Aquificaceae bacterium]
MDLAQVRQLFESLKEKIQTTRDLEKLRQTFLGKKGYITQLFKELRNAKPEERRELGKLINTLREEIEEFIKLKGEELKRKELEEKLKAERLDITLPGDTVLPIGSKHPLSAVIEEITEIFKQMGFSVETGPEVEKEEYNFDMLNIPKHHPARDMQDTFYVNEKGYLLRTHTSPVQVRTLLKRKPPVQIIAPGRVYRRDDDPTHSPMFFQVEGLVVNENVSFANMVFVLKEFLRKFFEKDVPVRFRPSYFPFTEPSAEVDIGCVICSGKGCRVCKGTGWLEVLGAGMVHPNVLSACGIDTEKYRGFAFGLGVDRFAMLKYRIDNIKLFYENDIRFLKQFVSL